MALPKVVYLVGRVHGPGKPSIDDLEVLTDEFTQQELDDLDLNGLPLTIDHPPPNTPISAHPELVCGKVSMGLRGVDGSKRIFACVHTDTPAGATAFARLKAKESGLSLGHLYEENRYVATNELHSRVVTGDHVALCAVPRREGCRIEGGGYELPVANLTNGPDISPGMQGAASDSSFASSSSLSSTSQLVMASGSVPMQVSAPAASSGGVAQPSGAQQAAPQGGMSHPPVPEGYTMGQALTDLDDAAKQVADMRAERETWGSKFQAQEAEMNKIRNEHAALAAERDRLLKEQGEEKQRQAAAHQKAMMSQFREIQAQLKAVKEMFPEINVSEMDEAQFKQTYAPDGISNEQAAVNSEHVKQFHALSFAAASSAANYARAVQENEQFRREFAGGTGANPGMAAPKRMRAWSTTPSLPVTPSAAAPPVTTSYGIVDAPRSMYNPTSFNAHQHAQGSQHLDRMIAQHSASRQSSMANQKFPPGYIPPK